MKRWISLLMSMVSLLPLAAVAQQETDSALLVVTGAYYDESGRVMVTARPARVELPQGAPREAYRLVEENELVFELREDAYIAVPQTIPLDKAEIAQAQAQDFPLYINDFKYSLEHTAFLIAPPEKGDGIRYTQYSLLYQAAVSGDSILSLMYHQLD